VARLKRSRQIDREYGFSNLEKLFALSFPVSADDSFSICFRVVVMFI